MKNNNIGKSSQFGDFALMVLSNSTSPEIEDFLLSQSKSIPAHKLKAIATELKKLEMIPELGGDRGEISEMVSEMQKLSREGKPLIY